MITRSLTRAAVMLMAAACQNVFTPDGLPISKHPLRGDHGDFAPYPAADITDLHAFVNGDNLVIALSTNPVVPSTSTSYAFPNDLTFEINIDNDSEVFDDPLDPVDVGFFGGTILDPANIGEDVTFRVHFDATGIGIVERIDKGQTKNNVKAEVFYGLRDDPFIRTTRLGRNIAAIVIEVPVAAVLKQHAPILIWATTKLDGDATQLDLFGRPLAGSAFLNRLHPRDHFRVAGVPPNVLIYDTTLPARFPNGRALIDDVIDLACLLDTNGDGILEPVGNCNQFFNDLPAATTNDVPFLSGFPYLAAPHPPF